MTGNRPSDRAIAQALEENFAKYGNFTHYPSIMKCARELDATAAPVVVGEDAILAAMRPHLDKADGGYCCGNSPDLVVAAGMAAAKCATGMVVLPEMDIIEDVLKSFPLRDGKMVRAVVQTYIDAVNHANGKPSPFDALTAALAGD